MKTLIAALALLSLAAGPLFAQSLPLYSGGYGLQYRSASPGEGPNLWTTGREGLVQAH
jgi:hypothetical protein